MSIKSVRNVIYDEIEEEKMANELSMDNTAPRSSTIRDNRDTAFNELEILNVNISDLFEVLEPVLLREESKSENAVPKESAAESDIASSFETITSRLHSANVRLTELRGRIDL